jgi:hypothetical protein
LSLRPNLTEMIMQTHFEFTRSFSRGLKEHLLCGGLALAMFASLGAAGSANAQTFFQTGKDTTFQAPALETCSGLVKMVRDATNESLSVTSVQYGTGAGGGQGGQFDPNPILSIPKVTLQKGQCINAHLSALVGSGALYGKSTETMFQVALVPVNGGAPIAMEGHYATPYGVNSPAVATAAEPDVDMFAANFYQGLDGDVPAGVYNVNVYWAGAPNPGGAIGSPFVLKLYIY